MNNSHRYTVVLVAAFSAPALGAAAVQAQGGWTGNMTRNPGFEEDFVNANAEGHVLSFKGDWYYNQKDLIPDYWAFKGAWTWNTQSPHSGKYTLKLAEGTTASQSFVRALSQSGGGAWGGAANTPIPVAEDELSKFAQPWKASVWCRGGGKIKLGSVEAEAKPGAAWQLLTVELPADQTGKPSGSIGVTLTGPGEFDDVVIEEKLSPAPNLVANASFEQIDKEGYPASWSQQKKFRAIGPTYYVWTDWNHAFRPNSGEVSIDPLVSHSGKTSLRFDVHPGDEKLVESDLIAINQDKPRVIEVGVFVRADRIKLIDVRCVDQDGIYMPGYRPRQPEYKKGGTFLYGNGTFEWRYVRKFFATSGGQPLKAFRVRLCARGMNGNTLDDSGTRPYSMATGTVWWDDLRVTERTTDGAALKRRRVKLPPQGLPGPGSLVGGQINLGQRFYGHNTLSYQFTNNGSAAPYALKLTTTLPNGKPVVTISRPVSIARGKSGTLAVPYSIDQLAGELTQQGSFEVELQQAGKKVAGATYRFNTWPDVIDFDVSRSYNYPNENPVTISLNLGVSDATLARVKKLEMLLFRPSDRKVLSHQTITNLKQAFDTSIQGLPKTINESFEFNLPTPGHWVDRTNLLMTKFDLSPLKTWPHDQPTRDTVLFVRGVDAAGKVLFHDKSDPFCRMQAPPKQAAIKTVAIRDDGAVLVNGEPRFLTGATHQHNRMNHTLPIMEQLGIMGHRLSQQMDFQKHKDMWTQHKLYALQMKPGNKIGGTVPITQLTPEQMKEFQQFVASGGMQNVISINTGGWEATINFDDAATVAKHKASNDAIRKLSGRPIAISTSGAFNAWWLNKLTVYDINHAETEMWGPMDFNVIFTPYMKRAGKTTAWVYLPQLYDNHPFERYRFETYENIIRGSAGVSMIQGIGDPSFNRGLAGELRYLEKPLYSQEKAPAVTLEPSISHKVTRYKNKTYVLATNAGPIIMGKWKWKSEHKHSGRASHEGDSHNTQWFRPDGVRIHGFRGLQMPELIQAGDKIVQHVWIDPAEKPDWVIVAVRGDGRFAHNAVLGNFQYETFRKARGNVLMYSELNHSVWHECNWVMDDKTYARGVKIMGKKWADRIKAGAEAGRAKIDKSAYQAKDFHNLGAIPKPGQWHRIEIDATKAGLVGKLVDGFAYLTHNGRALWDSSTLERDGEVVRVFCEDTVGIDRQLLSEVRVAVPDLKKGSKVRVLFEDRTIEAEEGGFVDNFVGTDTYGYENGAVIGDLFGFVKDPDRELAQMMPSGHGYSYGPTAVHIYEITH